MLRKRCGQCSRFRGDGERCKEDEHKRLAVHAESTACLNII